MAITTVTTGLLNKSARDAASASRELDRTLTAAWVKAWDGLTRDAEKALTSYLAASKGRWPRPSEISRSVPLRNLLTDVGRAMTGLVEQADMLITAAAERVATGAAEAQTKIISSQLPVAWRPVLMESPAMANRLESVINRASRRITTLTRAVPSVIDRSLRQILSRGVTTGRSATATIRRMVRKLESAFNAGLARTLTIAGTEIMDAHRAATAAGMLDHMSVLSGWIWVARMDRTTCAACLSMHGSVHALDQPGPDGHPRCRCQKAPKTKSWKELGMDIGLDDPFEPEDLVKDARDFFDGLPEADQLKIMGPTRLGLLRRGVIKWSDLAMIRPNPRWRRSYVPTPVSRLNQR